MHAWEQIQLTLDFIEEHLNEDISTEYLAGLAALSPFYYQRLFRRLVKKPVGEYIKLRSMAKATELLLNKDQRILDTALDLGFSSHEHFTRCFKETFGITPEEYRRSPCTMNYMTKPELLLHYTLIDEGVPLITDGIVLELNRKQVEEPILFAGFVNKTPVQFTEGLGTESGVDPLGALWDRFHEQKESAMGSLEEEEIGVSYPCTEEGYFNYFAGAKVLTETVPEGFQSWTLPEGEYLVCSFEAENFDALVLDALYKANQYLFNTWLPNHKLTTEPLCAERYASHAAQTASMEIWLKLKTD